MSNVSVPYLQPSLCGVAITADGRHAISITRGHASERDGQLLIWECASGRCINSIPIADFGSTPEGQANGVSGLFLTPDDRFLIAVLWYGQIWIWEMSTGSLMQWSTTAVGVVSVCGLSPGTRREWGEPLASLVSYIVGVLVWIFTFYPYPSREGVADVPRMSAKAITSMCLGLVALPTGLMATSLGAPQTPLPLLDHLDAFLLWVFIAAIASVVLGHFSLRDIRKSQGSRKGAGIALAGMVMSYAQIAILTAAVLLVLWLSHQK